jgi:protein TonB
MHAAAHAYFRDIQLDPKRIAGISATLAVHALLLMVLFTPAQWSPPAPAVDPGTDAIPIDTRRIPPPPPPPPPPTHEAAKNPDVPRQTTVPVAPIDEPRPNDVFVDKDAVVDDESDKIAIADKTFEVEPRPTGPQQLDIIDAIPPIYPIDAIRKGIEGKVVLRIEVDANGHPTAGVVEKSSGNRLLDNAALKTVLAKWRFKPATYNGQSIAATALVPVVFTLTE